MLPTSARRHGGYTGKEEKPRYPSHPGSARAPAGSKYPSIIPLSHPRPGAPQSCMKLYEPGGLGGKKPLSLPLRPAPSPPGFAPQTRRSPQHTPSSRVPSPLHLSSDMPPLSLPTDQERSYWAPPVAIAISVSSSLWLLLTECPLCPPKVLYSECCASARRFLHSNTHFTDEKTGSEGTGMLSATLAHSFLAPVHLECLILPCWGALRLPCCDVSCSHAGSLCLSST